jgi:hypothetical protein
MNRLILAALVALTFTSHATMAWGVEDGDIIGQCLEDNEDEGQSTQALATYCSCANERMMQDNYGRDIDISEWEKMNPDGQEACSKEAGWVSRPE